MTHPPLFATVHGQPISFQQFTTQVQALAEALPEQQHIINFCENRYYFTLAFVAALRRKTITLLAPDRGAHSLRLLDEQFPDALWLGDGPLPGNRSGLRLDQMTLQEEGQQALPPISKTQTALIAFTSGSTAEPQIHTKTWGSLCESARLINQALGSTHTKTIVATVPAQHMYGLELSVLLPLCQGAVLDAGKPFYPADIADALRSAAEPRVLVTTPVHLRALAEANIELPRLDMIVSATAPLSRDLAADCEHRFGAPLLEIYGCTETGSIASRRTLTDDEWQLFEGVELDRATVRADYLPEPVILNDVIETLDARRFRLLGRSADLVNIAGKRHSLGALNQVLLNLPGVVDSTFFMSEENESHRQRLTAFAVAPTLSSAVILDYLREQLDPVFVPRTVYLVEALPRNPTGKLPRQTLEEWSRMVMKERKPGTEEFSP